MTSNFNSNRRTQEFNFKSKVFDDYPGSNMNSINYDVDNVWLDNNVVTPRMTTNRRTDNQSMRSSNFNENATKSKDEFSIYGSFVRQKSERKSGTSPSERSRMVPRQSSTFKNLPVKSQPSQEFASSEYSKIVKTENITRLQSQPKYNPQSTMSPDSLFDLIQNQDVVDYSPYPSTPKYAIEDNSRIPVDQEIVVAQKNSKIESALPVQSKLSQPYQDDNFQIKDQEISRLQKSVQSKNKKIDSLKDNNEKLQEHIKNLLNERKQLLNQIENTEFEEIIEEEEVQEAKPNNIIRQVTKTVESSHENCIQRGKVTIEDLPSHLLDSYRNEIIHQIKELKDKEHRIAIEVLNAQNQRKIANLQVENEALQKVSVNKKKITIEDLPSRELESYREQIVKQVREQTEIENRSLMESLKMQQQKKLSDLQAQYETVQKVSVQSIKKTRYNQIFSEANMTPTPSPKALLTSIGVDVSPTTQNRQCQSEVNSTRSSLNEYLEKTNMSSSQKYTFENILSSIEKGNYDELLLTLGKTLCKSSSSIGISNTPVYFTRSSNTIQIDSVDASVEFNAPIDIIKKPVVSQESRSVMVKPVLLQRGCQPEDTFKFETGTMTDQIFCRSQGMMTVMDYTDRRTPQNIDQEAIHDRCTSRSESRKQTISHSTYMTSPTKDFLNIHQERSLSPRIIKPVHKLPETVVEDIVEIKTFKVESKPKPINVIEEVKHVVEETTQHVTTVLDQNKVPKPEIPTTIECWETISHLKDGEVIDKTETYHDQLVSTDAEKIKEHLNRFNLSHSTELSPTLKLDSESIMKFDEKSIKSKNTENKSSSIKLISSSTDFASSSKVKETKTNRNNSTSSENSSHSPEIKAKNIKPNFSKPSLNESTHSESEYTIVSSGSKKPLADKEIKVQNRVVTSKPKESMFLIKSTADKEMKVQQDVSKPTLKGTTYHKTEQKVSSSEVKKPIEVKEIKVEQNINQTNLKKTTYEESIEKFSSSNTKKPSDIKEIKIEKKSSIPINENRVTRQVELKSNLGNTKESSEVKEVKEASGHALEKTRYEESEQTFNLVSNKKPIEVKDEQNISPSTFDKTVTETSEHTFSSIRSKKPIEVNEIKVEYTVKKPSREEFTLKESEQTFTPSLKTNSNEIKEVKVENNFTAPNNEEMNKQQSMSAPYVKETTYHVSEQTFTLPVREKTTYQESEQTFSFNSMKKPTETTEIKVEYDISSPKSKEASYYQSQNTVVASNTVEPRDIKEIKIQPSSNQTTMNQYYQSELSVNSSSTGIKRPEEVKVQRIFTTPSTETTSYESEHSISSSGPYVPDEIKSVKTQSNFSAPILRETTYEETEQITTTTTSTSSIPMTLESATNLVQSKSPHSIGMLSSPKAFQSYSSNKSRSNFSSSRMENYSFESDEKFVNPLSKVHTIPIQIKSRMSTEATGHSIPINDSQSETTTIKVTKIPINMVGSSYIASSDSSFYSLSSSTEQNKTNEPAKYTTDVSEIVLSETVFKSCTELLFWLKTINLVTTSTIEFIPSNLVSVSSSLIDWWADITMKLDASKLMATVQYLTSTFSKNLLKFLMINLDRQGNTCLHYIIGHQMWESFSVLESTKLVDPNIYNSQGYTVLMVACTSLVSSDKARENLRRLALSANVNLTSRGQGQTAIFIAALHNNSYMIQMLYTLGADINIRDNEDNTPLMIACSKNHVDAVSTIMSWSGVLVDLKNKDGKTAFDIAQEGQFSDVLEIFRQRKSTKVSELSSHSRIMENTYRTSRSYGAKKF